MKKRALIIATLVIGMISFAQQDRTLEIDKETNLTAVTYFHDNGVISQKGFYTKEGNLHGQWFSYNQDGTKIVSAKYENGQKVGKWFYWVNDKLKEVDYSNNAIASVNEWTQNGKVASNE